MESRVEKLEQTVSRLTKDLGDSNCEIFTLRHRLAQLERRIPLKPDELIPWTLYAKDLTASENLGEFSLSPTINSKIILWQGDITRLTVDAIVTTRSAEGATDGASKVDFGLNSVINEVAGPELKGHDFSQDPTITPAYKLPSTYVIHVKSPRPDPASLTRTYEKCLSAIASDAKAIRSVAFPCIGTGRLGQAWRWTCAETALNTVRTWMDRHHSRVDKVIFCVYGDRDRVTYEQLMQEFFPIKR